MQSVAKTSDASPPAPPLYLALCGGVGGAKLAHGLARELGPEQLHVVVNVGDDFQHLSLTICPDLDTVLYTLADVANPSQGWGRADESWKVLEEVEQLGGDSWFRLGDKDLALHLLRKMRLDAGWALTDVVADLARRLGISASILPVTDDPVRTHVETDTGYLAFQDYFVRRRCEPTVRSVHFVGAASARLNPRVEAILESPRLAGVILCPSNPYLSIAPMLAVPGFRERLRDTPVPVIAVSPIVGGEALKGPAAKMMVELGRIPSAAAIVEDYADFVDAVIIDGRDAELAKADSRLRVTSTVMTSALDRRQLARYCVELVESLRHEPVE